MKAILHLKIYLHAKIYQKYLEQIIPLLNRSHLLTASKGHMGGYQLAKHPSQITVKDILESAEGNLSPVSCMHNISNQCEQCNECYTLPIYKGLHDVVINYLDSITLEDVINHRSSTHTYHI